MKPIKDRFLKLQGLLTHERTAVCHALRATGAEEKIGATSRRKASLVVAGAFVGDLTRGSIEAIPAYLFCIAPITGISVCSRGGLRCARFGHLASSIARSTSTPLQPSTRRSKHTRKVRDRGSDNLTTARRSQNSSASKIRTRCACRLIAQEKTSAASCFTREEGQWMAVRLMRSAHY
jgi:hypothetical protein